MAEPRKPNGPDNLSEAEAAFFASGGDTAALEKEGFTAPEPPRVAEPAPPAEPARADAPAEPDPVDPELTAEPEDSEFDERGKPKTRGKWVSKKALDAERSARKKALEQHEASQRETQQLREERARLDERFKLFQEALTVPEQPAAPAEEQPIPDMETDIFGYIRARDAQLDRTLKQIQDGFGQFRQMDQTQRENASMLAAYQSDARQYVGKQPDFIQAYQFLVQQRDAELAAAGYRDQNQRMQFIVSDEADLVRNALQSRVSPAERIYAMAKARGYQPAAAAPPAPAAAANGAANGNGAAHAAPAPAPAAPAKPTAAEEIARLQAGQDAAMSLSNVGGNRPATMSIEDLINMPQEEFASFARKNPRLYEEMLGKGPGG